jgi:hypothetical protein
VSREDDDSYEEIPFQFHGLEKSFANIADHAVSRVREWFVSGDPMFNFRASRLLASSGRPEFDRMCRDAAKRQFDVVMAWSVDRLGRSLQDLVAFLSELHALRIDLLLHQQGLRNDPDLEWAEAELRDRSAG